MPESAHTAIPTVDTATILTVEQRLQAQFERLEQQFLLLKEQTRQAQQLAALGTAAAMIAHEFNNLMTPVLARARHAIDSGDTGLMVKALELTLKQADIMTAMSDRVLGLAVNEAQRVERVTVAQMVADAQDVLFRDLSKDGISLYLDVPEDLAISVDPRQVLQVFFNLLLNARQAIKSKRQGSGRIKISARPSPGQQVAIRIADNGCGIPPDDLERIFEAFYTTKRHRPNKSGVGLGLCLCLDIVEDHHGQITVDSQPGEGATFTLLLPAAD